MIGLVIFDRQPIAQMGIFHLNSFCIGMIYVLNVIVGRQIIMIPYDLFRSDYYFFPSFFCICLLLPNQSPLISTFRKSLVPCWSHLYCSPTPQCTFLLSRFLQLVQALHTHLKIWSSEPQVGTLSVCFCWSELPPQFNLFQFPPFTCKFHDQIFLYS